MSVQTILKSIILTSCRIIMHPLSDALWSQIYFFIICILIINGPHTAIIILLTRKLLVQYLILLVIALIVIIKLWFNYNLLQRFFFCFVVHCSTQKLRYFAGFLVLMTLSSSRCFLMLADTSNRCVTCWISKKSWLRRRMSFNFPEILIRSSQRIGSIHR